MSSSNQLVFVYKSQQKRRHYLYLARKDAFAAVPEGLLSAFGTPQFMMTFVLGKHEHLPKISKPQLEEALATKGYLLRIDLEQEEENLINVERRLKGLKPLDKEQLESLFK